MFSGRLPTQRCRVSRTILMAAYKCRGQRGCKRRSSGGVAISEVAWEKISRSPWSLIWSKANSIGVFTQVPTLLFLAFGASHFTLNNFFGAKFVFIETRFSGFALCLRLGEHDSTEVDKKRAASVTAAEQALLLADDSVAQVEPDRAASAVNESSP